MLLVARPTIFRRPSLFVRSRFRGRERGRRRTAFEDLKHLRHFPQLTCREPRVFAASPTSTAPPVFLRQSPAGHFKGEDPTVSITDLQSQWVDGAQVIYIGKANLGASGTRGLRKRPDEFRAFGAGPPVGHRGGKQIWQLADSSHLLVAWKPTADGAAVPTELELLAAFRQVYGRLPFANMRE